jgi:uncharacterized paraquat-inducible protein A
MLAVSVKAWPQTQQVMRAQSGELYFIASKIILPWSCDSENKLDSSSVAVDIRLYSIIITKLTDNNNAIVAHTFILPLVNRIPVFCLINLLVVWLRWLKWHHAGRRKT